MLCRPKFPVVTLTTDFGLQDHYVASMKGVILSVNPATPIVDITHDIPPYSIISGAYAISQAAPYFPPNTVHVVVVDPGVGTARRPILLRAGGHIFIGPDNGVVSLVAAADEEAKCFEITRRDLMRSQISTTFHGRDVFAPVGAAVSCGKVAPEDVGPQIYDWKRLGNLASEQVDGQTWRGQILSIDRFGNLITNLPSSRFSFSNSENFALEIGSHSVTQYANTFGEASPGEIFAYSGSSGYIEVGVNQGNAAQRIQGAVGDPITLRLRTAGGIRTPEKLAKAL